MRRDEAIERLQNYNKDDESRMNEMSMQVKRYIDDGLYQEPDRLFHELRMLVADFADIEARMGIRNAQIQALQAIKEV